MLILMRSGCRRDEVDRVLDLIDGLGRSGETISAGDRVVIGVSGGDGPLDPSLFRRLPGVERTVAVTPPYRLGSRERQPERSEVKVGPARIGRGQFSIIAGPCAVENEEQILSAARIVKRSGADLLRGGAFKPRSSPYSFRGLGERALRMLARAREETGLPVVTEALDEDSLAVVEEYADVIQVGARNMQNFSLLRRAGRSRRPILLKRGLSATLDDLLMSAEYLLDAGNERVVLCERGIQTFSRHSRFTLDLSVIPATRETSHLPILVDPSHATGIRSRVAPMARAALAAGADGVMLEMHPSPEGALSDGAQALPPDAFASLAAELRTLASVLSRHAETVP